METPASVARHPIHPMLVGFPIGLWIFSFVCDIAWVSGGADFWAQAAFLAIAGGIIGAVAAAIPGLIDLFALRSAGAFKTALAHMAINVLALVLFLMSLLGRLIGTPTTVPLALSALGVVAILISGWLGGDLVYVRGVAVDRRGALGEERPR
jgi:uncharacterized membrane protein